MPEVGEMVKARDRYLASHTVLGTPLHLNSDEHLAEDVGFCYRGVHLGGGHLGWLP
jgi:hypothetical protein